MCSLPLGLLAQPAVPTLVSPSGNITDEVIPGVAPNATNTGADYQEDGQGNRMRVLCWDGDTPGLAWHLTTAAGATHTGNIPLEGARVGQLMEEWKITADYAPTSLPEDPDIVTYYDHAVKQWFAVVTFKQTFPVGTRILYSIYQYEPKSRTSTGGFGLVPGAYVGPIGGPGMPFYEYPQLVSPGGNTEGWTCTYPNLDTGLDGMLAFTYAEDSHIFGRTRDIGQGQVSPLGAFSAAPLQITPTDESPCQNDRQWLKARHPDVCIRQERGEGEPLVQFCYEQVVDDLTVGGLTHHQLVVTSLTVPELAAGVAPPCAATAYLKSNPNQGDDPGDDRFFETPRIAAWYGPGAEPEDFMVVVRELNPASQVPHGWQWNWIDLYTRQMQASPTVRMEPLANGSHTRDNIAHCGNTRPVVTTVTPATRAFPNTGVTAWNYSAYGRGNTLLNCLQPVAGNDPEPTNFEVVSRTAKQDGEPLFAGRFSQINDDLPGRQNMPSVAGGRGTGTQVDGFDYYALYIYLNAPDNSIRYQDAPIDVTSLRPAPPTEPISLAPNPIDASSTLTLRLADPTERILRVELLTPLTSVRATKATTAVCARATSDAGMWSVAVNELLPTATLPGVYAVRVHTDKQVRVVRLVYSGGQ